MAHWQTLTFFVVSCSLAFVATLILASNASSLPQRIFSVFLLLVAANFGLDWIAKAYPVANLVDHPAYQASKLVNPFDAAALLYFASAYPRRRGVAASTRLAFFFILLPLAVFALYVLVDPLWFVSLSTPNVFVFAYFGACYLAALVLAAQGLRGAEFASTRAALRPLLASSRSCPGSACSSPTSRSMPT